MLCAIENATVALVAQHILFASVPNERMYLHCIVRIPNGPLCNVPCEKGKFFSESHPAQLLHLPLPPSVAKNKRYDPWHCCEAPSDRLPAERCRDFRQSGFLRRLSEYICLWRLTVCIPFLILGHRCLHRPLLHGSTAVGKLEYFLPLGRQHKHPSFSHSSPDHIHNTGPADHGSSDHQDQKQK